MIKKIEDYPELADPQLQPRYSGIPTFFRLPHTVRLDEVDIGLVGVPFDDGHREISAAPGVLEAWEANKTSVGFRNASMPLRIANYARAIDPAAKPRLQRPLVAGANSPDAGASYRSNPLAAQRL
jgi:arginase family enzyme